MVEERRRAELLRLKRLQAIPPDHELEKLYMWLDQIPLSRPKKNLARDFSDGVMVAELVSHFVPKLVEIHNYTSTFATNQKEYNWFTLTKKVFLKLNLDLTPEAIRAIAKCVPYVMENFLMVLREKLDIYLIHSRGFQQEYEDDIMAVAMLDRRRTAPNKKVGTRDSPRRRPTQSQMTDFHIQETPYSPSWLENPEVKQYQKQFHVEMVSKEILEEKNAVFLERNMDVQMLQAKIEKLENWSELKDRRIEDLSRNLEKMRTELDYQKQRQLAVQQGPVHLKKRKI